MQNGKTLLEHHAAFADQPRVSNCVEGFRALESYKQEPFNLLWSSQAILATRFLSTLCYLELPL